MIIKGKINTDFNQYRILFVLYSLVHTGTSNKINRRIIPSIAINESNNRGGH